MKVLIISANSLPAAPTGPAYLAGAVRQAGHQVEVFERLFAVDLEAELGEVLRRFAPDVVGISIRVVFGDALDESAPWGTRHSDLRPQVKEIVQVVRRHSKARIVLGGPGFNYYAANWLDYLDVADGIRGEGEESFPLYLRRLAEGGDLTTVPGCVVRRYGGLQAVSPAPVEHLDGMALPAYDLFDLQRYAGSKVTPAIITKRGCASDCSYCPYARLEGKRYRLKSPERVLAEIEHTLQFAPGRRILFCDNSFNAPQAHAERLCRAFIEAGVNFQWGSGDIKPVGVTDDFCQLLEDSGCYYANLAVESASDSMLKSMRRGYTAQQVRQALESLSRSRVPWGASLMLGAPGETPETIAETLGVLQDYTIPLGVWVTVGVYLWTDYQDLVGELRQAGVLRDEDLFSGLVYIAQGLPEAYLRELVGELRSREGYAVQFNHSERIWPAR